LEAKEVSAKRSLTPDLSRGFAIFLVIWGHVIQQGLYGVTDVTENLVFKWIYSFHMPLFMLISGFFFYHSQKKKTLRDLVVNKIGGFLKTLVVWNTVCYGCRLLLLLLQNEAIEVSVKAWLEEVFMGYWFLWAILSYTTIVGIVTKLMSRKWWIAGCFILIPVLMISPCRWVILSMYPFFVVGIFYSKFIDEGRTILPYLKYLFVGCYFIGMVYYIHAPAIGNGEIKGLLDVCIGMVRGQNNVTAVLRKLFQTGLFYFLGLTGSATLIIAADWLGKRIKRNAMVRSIAWMGQHSLQIYILQRVLVEIILSNVYQGIIQGMVANWAKGDVLLFTYVGSLIVSTLCIFIIFVLIRYILSGKLGKVLFAR